ncbi:uncharacterized protein PV07_12832, partial [Cladophialophora immunda]
LAGPFFLISRKQTMVVSAPNSPFGDDASVKIFLGPVVVDAPYMVDVPSLVDAQNRLKKMSHKTLVIRQDIPNSVGRANHPIIGNQRMSVCAPSLRLGIWKIIGNSNRDLVVVGKIAYEALQSVPQAMECHFSWFESQSILDELISVHSLRRLQEGIRVTDLTPGHGVAFGKTEAFHVAFAGKRWQQGGRVTMLFVKTPTPPGWTSLWSFLRRSPSQPKNTLWWAALAFDQVLQTYTEQIQDCLALLVCGPSGLEAQSHYREITQSEVQMCDMTRYHDIHTQADGRHLVRAGMFALVTPNSRQPEESAKTLLASQQPQEKNTEKEALTVPLENVSTRYWWEQILETDHSERSPCTDWLRYGKCGQPLKEAQTLAGLCGVCQTDLKEFPLIWKCQQCQMIAHTCCAGFEGWDHDKKDMFCPKCSCRYPGVEAIEMPDLLHGYLTPAQLRTLEDYSARQPRYTRSQA